MRRFILFLFAFVFAMAAGILVESALKPDGNIENLGFATFLGLISIIIGVPAFTNLLTEK